MAPKRKQPTPPARPKIDPATKAAAQKRAVERAALRNARTAPGEEAPRLSEIARGKVADDYKSDYWAQTDAEHQDLSVAHRAAFVASRQEAQIEKLRAMGQHDEITNWSDKMVEKHGSRVQYRHEITLDGQDDEFKDEGEAWRLGLALGLFGEAPEHWPEAWTDDHAARAQFALSGLKPVKNLGPAAKIPQE